MKMSELHLTCSMTIVHWGLFDSDQTLHEQGAQMALDIGPVGIWTSSRLWRSENLPEAAAELDELGFGALWLGSSHGDLELHEALLAATRRLVVVTGIINIWTDPPAKVIASYQRVNGRYPDRLLIGLGSSHAGHINGQEYRQPLQRLARYLDDLDAVDPTVPKDRRVLAALGPKTLALAAERSAGAHPYLTTPEHTTQARDLMGPHPLLAPEQKVVLETDPAKARAIARNTLSLYLQLPNYTNSFLRLGFTTDDFAHGGSDRLVDTIFVWGDTDAVLRRIHEHHAAGANHVSVQLLTDGDRFHGDLPRLQWRELAGALHTTA
jgi:probable F420-dependent oxidoreductase